MELDEIIKKVETQALDLAKEWKSEQPLPQNTSMPILELICPNYKDFFSAKWVTLTDIFQDQDNETFLQESYRQIFGREIDETGLSHYLHRLTNGYPRTFILLELMQSEEAKPDSQIGKTWLVKNFKRLLSLLSRLRLGAVSAVMQKFLVKWERKRLKQAQLRHNYQKKLVNQYTQVASQLAQHYSDLTQKLIEDQIKLVGQIAQSQAMAKEVNGNYHQIQHKLNYHQHALSRLMEDLSATKPDETKKNTFQAHQQDKLDAYYVAFEDANRGSREEIRDKQMPYINRIRSLREKHPEIAELPVLDVGCGRGEWMQLLEESGIKSLGVDMNPVMIDDCQSIGLNVTHSDAVAYLKNQADNSLSVITGFHIIEHLPFEVLYDLFAEAYRALAPNGQIIFETPNPENILVGSHTFYHDFTHRNPITPSAIQFLAKYHNYTDIELIRLHPYPPEARVPGNDPLTERVNGHLTGPQDFAICAMKPEVEAQ